MGRYEKKIYNLALRMLRAFAPPATGGMMIKD